MRSLHLVQWLLFTTWACSSSAWANETGFGTGFFYNKSGDFFTNAHVINECKVNTIQARTSDGVWHQAKILAIDDEADIAALTISKPVEAFASIRLYEGTNNISIPSDVEDVFTSGYSDPAVNHFKLQYKWGQIQSWRDSNKYPYINRMRMNVLPGASGSPVLDYAGLLVGIVFAGSVDSWLRHSPVGRALWPAQNRR